VPPPGPGRRGPRNGLGAVTFVVVVVGALLAVFPATAAFGLLLCLVAIVPAILAYRRTRRGTATNRRRSVAAVALAPAFVAVAVVVGAATTPPSAGTVGRAADGEAVGVTTAGSHGIAAVAPAGPVGQAVGAAVPEGAAAVGPAAPGPANSDAAPTRPGQAQAGSARQAPRAQSARQAVAPQPLPAAQPAPAAKLPAAQPAPAAKLAPAQPAPAVKPAPAPKPPASSGGGCDEASHYVNVSGNCVLRPVVAAVAPAGASARCNDGTYSSSQHRSGTCSRHGGVQDWLKELPK
jgi:hypothetical protein